MKSWRCRQADSHPAKHLEKHLKRLTETLHSVRSFIFSGSAGGTRANCCRASNTTRVRATGFHRNAGKLQQEVTKGNNPPHPPPTRPPSRNVSTRKPSVSGSLQCNAEVAEPLGGGSKGAMEGAREGEAALEKPAGALGMEAVVICSSADLPL